MGREVKQIASQKRQFGKTPFWAAVLWDSLVHRVPSDGRGESGRSEDSGDAGDLLMDDCTPCWASL